MIKLRNNEDSHDEIQRHRQRQSSKPSIVPVLILVVICFVGYRFFISSEPIMDIPKNALLPTAIAPKPGQPGYEAPPTAEELANKYKIEPPVTDEQVKRMLAEMNGTPAGPSHVSPISSGQMLNFSGAQTPEMVRVQGQWFKKNNDNVYQVNGQNVYYEDTRKGQR